MRLSALILSALLLTVLWGCEKGEQLQIENGVTSLRVTLLSDTGSGEQPLDATDGLTLNVKVEALDNTGAVVPDYDGILRFDAKPGFIGRNGWEELEVVSGDDVSLTLKRGFGAARIQVVDDARQLVGVSETFYLPEPTISTIQSTVGDIDGSPWSGSFLRIETGRIVVTHKTIGGFYATDVSADSYNHIYVYTHGIPSLERGDVLSWVSGTVSEFYGLTELAFPEYEIDCSYYPVPEPIAITVNMMSGSNFDRNKMESLEAGLVVLENARVRNVDAVDFFTYGQWVAHTADGVAITVLSREALPSFDPSLCLEGTSFTRIVGNLRQHWAADTDWIIVPRDPCDVQAESTKEACVLTPPDYCEKPSPETTCTFED